MPDESVPNQPSKADLPDLPNLPNQSSHSNQSMTSIDFGEDDGRKNSTKSLPRARIQMERYIPTIIIIWAYSFLIPAAGVFYYFDLLIIPNISQFLQISVVFGDWVLLLLAALTPLVILGAFFLRLLLVVLFSRWLMKFCNWRSPHTELVSAQGIGRKEARAINYYHLRGVILRILKWEVSKSVYPWMVPWAFNFVGANKIGKGTVLEDQFFTQEFLETGENVYIGQGSNVSSHVVEGKYGAITLKTIRCGENTVIGPFNIIPPGSELEPHAEFLPMSALVKFRKVKGFSKYFGLPVGKISYKRYIRMLKIPEQHHPLIMSNKILKKQYKERKQKGVQEQFIQGDEK
ncbi:MAG: hypothetical protein ACTSYI_04375 [Promethearchaeota archaeon]